MYLVHYDASRKKLIKFPESFEVLGDSSFQNLDFLLSPLHARSTSIPNQLSDFRLWTRYVEIHSSVTNWEPCENRDSIFGHFLPRFFLESYHILMVQWWDLGGLIFCHGLQLIVPYNSPKSLVIFPIKIYMVKWRPFFEKQKNKSVSQTSREPHR